ncbi:host attachment family protein [Roseibium sp. MB-4]
MPKNITLKNKGWVVVADGEKALFLRNDGDEQHPNLSVFKKESQDNPPTREQGTDRPGRMFDGGPGHRSSVANADWHELAEEDFASDLADILYKRAHEGKFDELVLVAAPAALGQIRKALHKEVSDRVLAEVDKDLTNHPVDEIERIVLG